MQWILDNWVTVLLVGGMLGMHLFGHGHGHGKGHKKGHGQHGKDHDEKTGDAPAPRDGEIDDVGSNRDPGA